MAVDRERQLHQCQSTENLNDLTIALSKIFLLIIKFILSKSILWYDLNTFVMSCTPKYDTSTNKGNRFACFQPILNINQCDVKHRVSFRPRKCKLINAIVLLYGFELKIRHYDIVLIHFPPGLTYKRHKHKVLPCDWQCSAGSLRSPEEAVGSGSPSLHPACSRAPAAGTQDPQNALSPSRAPHSPDTQPHKRNNAQVNRQDKRMHNTRQMELHFLLQ